ncbi:MAG: hypothetical protein ACQKBT_00125, partial [Puniceicoccales bacterium]
SFALLPLAFILRDARRKLKKEEEIRQFERRGNLKHPVMVEDPQNVEEEVVVVRRKKKEKRSRKGRRRLSSAERPVVISREAEPEEEEAPFFGEGVLATEPGRQGNVQIDPWTGAAVQDGEERPSMDSLEMDMPEDDFDEEREEERLA